MSTILNNLFKTLGRPSTSGQKAKTSKSLGKRMLLLGGIVSGMTMTAQAQPEEVSHLYEKYSMKHYATSQEFNGASHAMAGTIFDYHGIAGNNGIHLLVDPSPFSTSVVYDHEKFDERAIGVHYLDRRDIVVVASLVDYAGSVGANGFQIIRHPSCKRDLIFAPDGTDYWPMGSIVSPDGKTLYICGYVTPSMRPGTHPDYGTSKVAFVMSYDLGSGTVNAVRSYDWAATSPVRRDYDMAHRMKFIQRGRAIWVGGICNGGRTGSAMMNMVIDPVTLTRSIDAPIASTETNLDYLATSFDIADDLNREGYSYVYGNYWYAKSSRTGMYPQPANYNITSVNAGTLEPAAGALNHVYFATFKNAWGTNLVYGNSRNTVILSGYQDAEKCRSSIPSTIDNVNPFLTEMKLGTSAAGDILVSTGQWSTILSAVGTGSTANPNSFYDLGNGLSNLVFGPVTTARDIYGVSNDEIILNAPVWNKATDKDLNIKYIRTDANLDPNCKISKCDTKYPEVTAYLVDKGRERRMDYRQKHEDVCPEDLNPIKVLDCASEGYFKGGSSTSIASVVNADEAVVAAIYPNPAHDQIQVKLNGQFEAGASVKVMLSDITGKQLSNLYEGVASGVNAVMKLPNLPQGLYNVTVIYNGAKLKSVPLVIN